MNALLVLYGGDLCEYALKPLFNEKTSLSLALEQSRKFPGVTKTVLLAANGNFPNFDGVQIEQRESWTIRSLLEKIAELQPGFDLCYFAFADTPFLDPVLAGAIGDRHLRYAAEYSYADGFPYGLAPEILSPGTAGILSKIVKEDGKVERDILFSVIQKDINAFDIEVEISTTDLSCHRLNLSADSKRNFLLLKNFLTANKETLPSAIDTEKIVINQPEILRTLPSYYPVQVYGGCPCECALCPYPMFTDVLNRKDFMDSEKFETLLDKIVDFSGDAVINLSLWGELSLHPDKLKLIEAVLKRSELSLVIETTGLGWKNEELEKCLHIRDSYVNNRKTIAPLSWIVSLDTTDSRRYIELRGHGLAEAESRVKKLFTLFPKDCYVQAVRVKGEEQDTEKFYRYWKEIANTFNAPNGEKNIIIQKYNDFCGALEKKQASDISPVIRQSCWHVMRDMPILIDGTVPLCREDLSVIKGEKNRVLGNVFTDSLENIWKNGESYYKEQCEKNYMELCVNCDEYYTYNF